MSAVRWARAYPDVLLAVVALVLNVVVGTFAARHQHADRSLDVGGYLLLIVGPALLLVRPRWPMGVLAGVFAATFGYLWLGYPQGPIWLPLIVAFGGVVLMGKRLVAYTTLAAGFVSATWVSSALRDDEKAPSVVAMVGIAAWLLALGAVTELIRYRGELRGVARREAAEARRTELETARRRASEERLDIARELHDVLAHSISMINVQAGVALELMDERPEQARASLATIKQASKDALVEVQAVLGALRQAGEQVATAPAPGLADLDRLVSGARAAGFDVTVHTDGPPRQLPAGADLAAFRILQESLTNVVRHSDATAVTVTIGYGADRLTVEVADNGPSAAGGRAPVTGGGNGIAGMRERAQALGGELAAGRSLAGGFRVRATLPLGEGA
ncbi:MAG TPA: sensor histidine kinase [Jatrophihabitantaceae bacterium]|nr:sensor histidine kinase [Jatrophihabitantaceae bacterium]